MVLPPPLPSPLPPQLPAPTKLHISLAVLQLSPPELAAQRAGISLEEAFSIDQARTKALPPLPAALLPPSSVLVRRAAMLPAIKL